MSQPMWSVSALNRYIKGKIDADSLLQGILIQGEISNFTNHSSGHWYFTLKDERSRVSCVMFASYAMKNKLIPKNGMKVIVKGNLSVFEASGQYQIYASKIQEDGIGDLYLEFERLKKQLSMDGLFDENHKKALPKYPMRIAVISGAETAALQDIRTTIARRWPLCTLYECYSLVQGEQAKYDIVRALKEADALNADVIILARGGGSIEDLWPFNEEIVARAVYDVQTPIVTGVGHEIDTTIVDFVADRRAATPTAAAELVTPDILQVKQTILSYTQSLGRIQKRLLETPMLQLDMMMQRLQRYLHQHDQKKQQLFSLQQQLQQSANLLVLNQQYHLQQMKDQMQKDVFYIQEKSKQQMVKQLQLLEAYSPLKVLKRGYAIVSYNEKQISSYEDVAIDETIQVRFHDGIVDACVTKKEKEA
ncbi:MAG: exodeoxyribonuclease VII large subunit [Erysipelotrichaceae bacterium]|nr:exodeoxyribonuclease VII large subunit [Erysipelotrichaceae bacterium]